MTYRVTLSTGRTFDTVEAPGWDEMVASVSGHSPRAWLRCTDGPLLNPAHVVLIERLSP